MTEALVISARGRDGGRRLRLAAQRLRTESRGTASVELAFVAPILVAMLAIVVMAGQGSEISRKVTQAASTLTDLATQQTDISASSSTYTYTAILNAASLVIAPYDSTQLSMVLSEIKTNGTTTGTVVWSKANSNGVALATGASVTVPAKLVSTSYVILGTATYTYNPLSVFFASSSIPLTESIYLAPRAASTVSCC